MENFNPSRNNSSELMANQKLQNLLYMVLVAGNFLNSGGYAGSSLAHAHALARNAHAHPHAHAHANANAHVHAHPHAHANAHIQASCFNSGNAAGMKISSLHKLTDIRSNR